MPATLGIRPRTARSRLTAFAAVVALSWSLLAAHGPLARGHMGAAMGKAMTICLAVIQGAVVVYGTRLVRRDRRRRAAVRFAPEGLAFVLLLLITPPVIASARAGPERLQVFRL